MFSCSSDIIHHVPFIDTKYFKRMGGSFCANNDHTACRGAHEIKIYLPYLRENVHIHTHIYIYNER